MANNTLNTRIILCNDTSLNWYVDLAYVTMTPAEITAAISAAVEGAKHTHDNKDILDATTASFTTALLNKLNGIAPGAEVNQNAFSKVLVGSTTVEADTKTGTLTLAAGSNVSITPDATSDKITIGVADGTTAAKGVVQLTDSTSSTSTTTAATPNSVKSAYERIGFCCVYKFQCVCDCCTGHKSR